MSTYRILISLRKLSAGLSYVRPRLAATLGSFLNLRRLLDAAQAVDQISRFFGKKLSDTASATDAPVKSFSRSRNDEVATSDAVFRETGKSFTEALAGTDAAQKIAGKNEAEALSASDVLSRSTSKTLSDSPVATDLLLKEVAYNRAFAEAPSAIDATNKTFEKSVADAVQASDAQVVEVNIRDLNKQVADSVYATDDVNGASADDDQTIQFFKLQSDIAQTQDNIAIVSAFARVYSDEASTSDVSTKAFTLSRIEQTVTLDSGFVKNQGYCDLDYFVEDYVGAIRTF